MKKKISLLTILVILLAFAFNLPAQTPQYYNYAAVTNTNYFPWAVLSGKEVQWLVLAHEFATPSQAPAGNITKMYFYMGNNATNTLTNVCIRLGLTTITSLPIGTIYNGPLDTVYYRSSVTLTCSTGAWMSIQLDHPFLYDTSKSLVVDIQQCAATTINMYSTQTALSNTRRTAITPSSFCTGWAVTYNDNLCGNMGIDIAPPSIPCTYSWAPQVSGTTNILQAEWTVNNLVAWAGGGNATVRMTTNGGSTWNNANPNPGVINGSIYNLCAFDANTAWCTTTPAATTFIYRTSNGGTNWTQVFSQAGNGFIDGIMFINANTGFAYGDPVGARWSLWKSTNGGINWDSTGMYLPQAGSEAGWNNSLCVVGNNVWFGTNNTRVYHSTNFGATGSWTAGTTTGCLDTYGVWFSSATKGMACGEIVMKTTDGGTTWTTAGTVGGTGNMTSIGGKEDNFWLTRGNNIYGTTDFGGSAWTTSYTGAAALWATNIGPNANQCVAGWSTGATGTIIKLTGNPVGIVNNNNQIPNSYKLDQNYPNPFNPTTKISFALPKAGNVELRVYDLLGREVAVLVNEFKTPGSYTLDFNASSIASGVYFYTIKSGDFTDTKKMVLIK